MVSTKDAAQTRKEIQRNEQEIRRNGEKYIKLCRELVLQFQTKRIGIIRNEIYFCKRVTEITMECNFGIVVFLIVVYFKDFAFLHFSFVLSRDWDGRNKKEMKKERKKRERGNGWNAN